MKAITLTQPWATLVAIGAKKIETRSRSTKYRGPLAIHAAKGYPEQARLLCCEEPFYSALIKAGLMQFGVLNPQRNDLPLGCVIATCELVQVARIPDTPKLIRLPGDDFVIVAPPEPELSYGDYTPGRYAWILSNINPLPEPIPARGALGLWEWEHNGNI